MATNDLMTELQKDSIKLDDDSERKVKTWNKLKTCIVADSQWMMEVYRKYLKILIVSETWNLSSTYMILGNMSVILNYLCVYLELYVCCSIFHVHVVWI